MTNKPTVGEFFAQYNKGIIFDNQGLTVVRRDREEEKVFGVAPLYANLVSCVLGVERDWQVSGEYQIFGQPCFDIIAVLDDAGNVLAGEIL